MTSTLEIKIETRHKCLEARIKFMVEFIVAMKPQVSARLIDYFIEKDQHFIYEFCDRLDLEPKVYIEMYNNGVGI